MLFFCIIFLFVFFSKLENVLAESLSDGLVAYYPFNGNANDESGNGKHGVNYGADLTENKFGIQNSAYSFTRVTDADGDYIQMPVNINPDVMPKSTIIVWVKIKNEYLDSGQAVFSNDNWGWDRAIFNWLGSGWGITKQNDLVGYHKVEIDKWYFIVGIFDQENQKIKLRVNDSLYQGNGYSNMGNNFINIGCSGHDTAYLDGSIDEVRIYNRVLTDEEIDELYNQFKGEEPEYEPFTFTHLSDIHLGSSWVPRHKWYEELSYPRFADSLYEIGRLAEKPDFVLVSGDIVEHADERWFRDYKSLTDGFTAQTGIGVHTVPGNHDRFRWATGSFFCQPSNAQDCDDNLAAYRANVSLSQDEYFTHKGIEFIGLDSGADFLPDFEMSDLKGDKGIESSGLTDEQMTELINTKKETPKVLYMHSPVFTGGQDEYGGGYLEDASIANNRSLFLEWATSSNLQLALTGHTHRDEAYDEYGYQYSDIANAENRPLFIQTGSATHDGGKAHGYRIVKAENGAVNPQTVSETGEYTKIISELMGAGTDELRVYDPLIFGEYVRPGDTEGLSVPFFAAEASRRILTYGNDDNKQKLQIWQDDSGSTSFDLRTRIEGLALDDENYNNDFGYRIGDALNREFVHFHIENKLADVEAKNISFASTNKYQVKTDWDELVRTKNIVNFRLSKNFSDSIDVPLDLEKLRYSLIASLFSPAELYVINSAGERTGIIAHESVEEIGYALSDEMRERVLLYSDDNFAGENLSYRVVGIPDIYEEEDGLFSLRIVHRTDDVIDSEVNVIDMPINASTTYQFRVDWERLSDTQGVIMEIDENGDGVFEIKIEMGKKIEAVSPRGLRETILAELLSVKTGNKQTDKKIDSIILAIRKSLDEKWWQNDYYLQKQKGRNVFEADLAAVIALRVYLGLDKIFDLKNLIPGFLQDRLGLPANVKTVFENTLDGLLRSDAWLARIAVNDFASRVDNKKEERILKNAETFFSKAEAAVLKNHSVQAVQFFRQAWEAVN